MIWESKPISELCIFAIDCVNKTAPVVDYETPYKMIRTTNVGGGFIDLDTVRYVEEETFIKWTRRSKPEYGDVIFSREAPVGNVGRFTSRDKNVFLGQRLFHYRPDPKLLDWKFLAYILQSDAIQGYVHGIAFGATVPHIKVADAENLNIPCPPVDVQVKIGNVLSAYDDLIENNQKRIKLLEDMAQVTYEEWFVRMKFPGHINANIDEITGLPSRWKRSNLSEVCDVTSSKRVFLEDYVEYGVPFYRGKEIILKSKNEKVSAYLYISKKKFDVFKKKFGSPNPGDILLTAVGTLGYPYQVNTSDGDFYFKDGNLIWLKGVNGQILSTYLISIFLSKGYRGYLEQIAIGSSQKALTIKTVKSLSILIPPLDVMTDFFNIINPVKKSIESLINQNELLLESRDILLPRLMTGIIDIEKIELPEDLLKRLE